MSSESDLQGLAELSALYREAPDERPPVQLDKRLLVAAHQEARRGLRWAAPLALAATLVLGVGLVSLLQRETPPISDAVAPDAKPLLSTEQSAPLPKVDTFKRQNMPAPPADMLMRPAAPSVRRQLNERQAQEAEARRPVPIAEPGLAAESPASIAQETARRSPKLWLQEIAELRRQGREAEAEAELRAFRAWYPDHPPGALEESGE